jgi:predicted DNA-binding transcriptional regulator YafY
MIIKELERIKRIDQLIRLESTGKAEDLARKLGVCRKQVYNIIEQMKDFGLEIKYNRDKETFYYAKPYKVNIKIEVRDMSEEELRNTDAGMFISVLLD